MILFKTAEQLKTHLKSIKKSTTKIGFVPTMGALHEGHLSLLAMSKEECDITICSIFVNPTQFNETKDFELYPVTMEHDILLLEKIKCDLLFLPSVTEIYPEGKPLLTQYPIGPIETLLEGSFRPGHFQGVCNVVHRLLKIVQPQVLFMGQKDYQQCMVIQKLLEITHLNTTIKLNIGATLRAASGLALSSRNLRLSEADKQKALAIAQSLAFIKQNINSSPIAALEEKVRFQLATLGFDPIDYVCVANAHTLEPITEWDHETPIIALIAAFLNGIRLIDNISLN